MQSASHRVFHWQGRLVILAVLSLVAAFALSLPSAATGNVTKPDFAGQWQLVLHGETGCGFETAVYTFTMNNAGQATNVTGSQHSSGCGDTTSTGDSFTIMTLNIDGSGTAGLTCGAGCGWNLTFQLSPDRTIMNVVDILNGANYIEGTAIHKNH